MESTKDLLTPVLERIKQQKTNPQLNRKAFQLLALQIIKDFNINKNEQGIIWRFCKITPLPQIQKSISELKTEIDCKPIIYIKYLMKKNR